MTSHLRRALQVRRWLIVLGTIAIINLLAGLVMSLHPDRLADLRRIVEWSSAWLSGLYPYAAPDSLVDYPPWALVVFAPLALFARIAPRLLAPCWAIVNLACLAWLARSLARLTGKRGDRAAAVALLCCACAASRTLSQFSLPAYACALAGAVSPSPVAAPLLVGLGFVKPQIGGVVWVWLLLERRWRIATLALAVPLALLLVFCGWSHEAPMAVMARYWDVLSTVHGGVEPFAGHTEIIPWMMSRWPQLSGLWPKVWVGLLALAPAILVAVFRRRNATRPESRLIQIGRCGVASLLAVRHLSYDFILLFPVVAASAVTDREAGQKWPRRIALGLLAAYLVIEPASVWRHLGSWAPGVGSWWASNLDRLLTIGVWLAISVGWSFSSPKEGQETTE